jgi:DedD protein
MAEAQERDSEVDTLQRRGRRRLVGAVALVLGAVIVLPMVFDPEPQKAVSPVSVKIPGEDDTKFAPKPVAKVQESSRPQARNTEEQQKPTESRKAEEPGKIEEAKKSETAAADPNAPSTERARAEAALGEAGFVVPVGAFANPQGVVAKLKQARVPYYTEGVSGSLTRVRAGPFSTRDAAENALEKLKSLGLKPGAVTTKTG